MTGRLNFNVSGSSIVQFIPGLTTANPTSTEYASTYVVRNQNDKNVGYVQTAVTNGGITQQQLFASNA